MVPQEVCAEVRLKSGRLTVMRTPKKIWGFPHPAAMSAAAGFLSTKQAEII